MFARTIAVIGSGYVGLTTGACLASLGHRVTCADIDPGKVARLRRGVVDILEPGLAELVSEGMATGRLEFVVGASNAVSAAEIVYLCVPTVMGENGAADLSAVDTVIDELRLSAAPGCVVVNKSTVPVGTAARTAELLGRTDVSVVSNPEFLREGSAVRDFLHPDRIVVGSDTQDAAERVAALYARLGAPTVLTDAASAEMMKYAANCFLAMKLSYVNAIAELCERLGANVLDVTEGIGYDRRIGQAFLSPGPGWGGSCLPKDTHALLRVSAAVDYDFSLLRASLDTNNQQNAHMVDKIRDAVGGTLAGTRIGLLGLAFKAGTGDLRDSPALAVAAGLRAEGAELVGFDPGVPEAVAGITDDVRVETGAREVFAGANAVVVLTEWPEFRFLDWGLFAPLMADRVLIDCRNLLDPDMVTRKGFTYHGIGVRSRGPAVPGLSTNAPQDPPALEAPGKVAVA